MEFGIAPRFEIDEKFFFDIKGYIKAGFYSFDFQGFTSDKSILYALNEEEFVNWMKDFKNLLDKLGAKIHQLHGLWVCPMYDFDKVDTLYTTTFQYYVRAMQGASILGCKNIVIHPRFPFLDNPEDESRQINIEFIKRLIPFAKKYNVRICLENMPFALHYTHIASIVEQINEINDENVGICLDTGHFNMFDSNLSISEAIKLMGNKLFALHCHDNDKTRDSHSFVGTGNFNWQEFANALKEINFQGVVSLETNSSNPNKELEIKENISLREELQSYFND